MSECDKHTPVKQIAYKESGLIMMARIVGYDDEPITQATINTITLTVVDEKTGEAADAVSLDVEDVIYDTLQTGAPWKKDADGYNFRYAALASQRPEGGRTYRYEFCLTPVSGEQFWNVYRVETKHLSG